VYSFSRLFLLEGVLRRQHSAACARPVLGSHFINEWKKLERIINLKVDSGSFRDMKCLTIVQEYINSFLLNNIESDLCVSILDRLCQSAWDQSLPLLRARFHSAKFGSRISSVNSRRKRTKITNLNLAKVNQISKLISSVFVCRRPQWESTLKWSQNKGYTLALCVFSARSDLMK
jgi:hypothetical protein